MGDDHSGAERHESRELMELAGGLEGLRAHLDDFYLRVFKDPMIGYLFMGQDRERLVERELEWTASFFGAELPYQGRPLRKAHGAHPIRRGHFHRRNQLLLNTLTERGAPQPLIKAWMEHSASLERAILGGAAHIASCERTSDE